MKTFVKDIEDQPSEVPSQAISAGRVSVVSLSVYGVLFVAWLIFKLHS